MVKFAVAQFALIDLWYSIWSCYILSTQGVGCIPFCRSLPMLCVQWVIVSGALFQLDIHVNNVLIEELTSVVHYFKAEERGRDICLRLKDNLSREQFEYPIRAQVNSRVVAKETVKAYRKDVTARVVRITAGCVCVWILEDESHSDLCSFQKSGHDMARKKALLDRQKEGKAKLRSFGNVRVNKDVFVKVLRKWVILLIDAGERLRRDDVFCYASL